MSPQALPELPSATVQSFMGNRRPTTLEFSVDHLKGGRVIMIHRDYDGNSIGEHVSRLIDFEDAIRRILNPSEQPTGDPKGHECDWGKIRAKEDGTLTCIHGHTFGPELSWPLGGAFPLGEGLQEALDVDLPGETPSETTLDALHDALSAPEPLTVADLSAKHIGLNVRIAYREDMLSGQIQDLGFTTESTYGGPEVYEVAVEFRNGTVRFPLTATVEVL